MRDLTTGDITVGRSIQKLTPNYATAKVLIVMVLMLIGGPLSAASGAMGWAYYGVKRASITDLEGRTSDGGKLRPESKGPMPNWEAIKTGDRFRTTEQVNLQREATKNSETVLNAPMPPGTCVAVIRKSSAPFVVITHPLAKAGRL